MHESDDTGLDKYIKILGPVVLRSWHSQYTIVVFGHMALQTVVRPNRVTENDSLHVYFY